MNPQLHFKNEAVITLLNLYRPIWSLTYMNNLAGWDTETYLPPKGIQARGQAQSDIAALIQEKFLDPEFILAFENANKQKRLTDAEKAVLRVIGKTIRHYQKLPAAFVKEFSQLVSVASVQWSKARSENNPRVFLPYLQKIFELTKKRADYLGYDKERYDAIFEQYEDGITTEELVHYFEKLKKFLLSIDLKGPKMTQGHIVAESTYHHTRMQGLNDKALRFLGYDPECWRLDVSSHPFSLFMAVDDIRLTTRYPEVDMMASLLPSIHEFGHGLFARNYNRELETTPLWTETSYALHESQSRFWENIIGRSEGFIKAFVKDFNAVLDSDKKLSVKDFWDNLNAVKPSLIRVDADELTYHWHIIIRFEIERAVLNDELKVADIPRVWNEKYQEYLGIVPTKHADGFLQDIHWGFGSIGYFPTYSLGSVTTALWLERIKKDLNWDENAELSFDRIMELNTWFKENIHQFGGIYTLEEVWQRIGGQPFSPDPWIKYIKNKYEIA